MHHRTRWSSMLCLVLLFALSRSSYTASYWMYYDCTPGNQTAVVLMNASEWDTPDETVLRLYDADGRIVVESSYTLTPYESRAIFLNDLLGSSDEKATGLAEVESSLLLQTSTWLGWGGTWLSVRNFSAAGRFDPLNVVSYWYGANYAHTERRTTILTILNPTDEVALGQFFLYDAGGTLRMYEELRLEPKIPVYLNLEAVAESHEDLWGLIDVQSNKPLLLVSDFYDAEGYLIDITVVDQAYYMESLARDPADGDS